MDQRGPTTRDPNLPFVRRVPGRLFFLSLFVCSAGLASAQDVPVQLLVGEAPLLPEQVRQNIATQLSRPVELVDVLPSEGAAVSLQGVARDQVDVRCRDAKGVSRTRKLSVSKRPGDAAPEVAMVVAELLSANPAPFAEGQAEQGAEIEGQVVDQQGAPVVEAKLKLIGAADAGAEATDTDQAGRFRIPPVPFGSYVLRAQAEGFEPVEHSLVLSAPQRGLVIQLQRLAPGSERADIEGQVRGPDGEPVPEAKLLLYLEQGGNRVAVESTDTDQAGRFRIPDVALGSYTIDVEAPSYVSRTEPVAVQAAVHDLDLKLEAQGAGTYHTTVQSTRAPLPTQDATSTTVITRQDIENIPGGSTRQLNDVIETQPGMVGDNYGAIHVRGNFAGLQLRVDGVQLPPAIQERLQQLLDPQIIQEAKVIVGGLPAEYGEDVGGVIDIKTRHPDQPIQGESTTTYGTYNHVEEQANVAGAAGPFSIIAAGMLQTTQRGLDPEAVDPILHDRLNEGRGFLRIDDRLTSHDRIELLGVYAESHYQIPIDPTLLPLTQGPANAMRGIDQYGNSPEDFVPYNANPTELEREAFGALSYYHDFDARSQLQIAPFIRYQQSDLNGDPASTVNCGTLGLLGATADPMQECSSVNHQVEQGGLQINQSIGAGFNDFKFGLLVDYQHSSVAYGDFTRLDTPPYGADPSLTASGEDDVDTLLAGIYFQDKMTFGKFTLFPGVRLDALNVSLQSQTSCSLSATSTSATSCSKTLWGPSFRLGAAYAFTNEVVLHGFVGRLWQPPSFDAPAAARILGAIPATSPVPFDLTAEEDNYAELGISARVIPQLTLTLTPWVRLSTNTIDDEEIGDTALTADYNYNQGRAWGAEFAANLVIRKNLRAFGNFSYQVSEGEGIATSQYLFTPQQINFPGYQATDNAQLFTANLGFDLADNAQTTHLSGLMRYGSGLRTGPINNATLPPTTIVDVSLRHRFDFVPLHPEVAFDVQNLFNVVYAYRISTGSLAGTSYGSLREFNVRLIIPFGS